MNVETIDEPMIDILQEDTEMIEINPIQNHSQLHTEIHDNPINDDLSDDDDMLDKAASDVEIDDCLSGETNFEIEDISIYVPSSIEINQNSERNDIDLESNNQSSQISHIDVSAIAQGNSENGNENKKNESSQLDAVDEEKEDLAQSKSIESEDEIDNLEDEYDNGEEGKVKKVEGESSENAVPEKEEINDVQEEEAHPETVADEQNEQAVLTSDHDQEGNTNIDDNEQDNNSEISKASGQEDEDVEDNDDDDDDDDESQSSFFFDDESELPQSDIEHVVPILVFSQNTEAALIPFHGETEVDLDSYGILFEDEEVLEIQNSTIEEFFTQMRYKMGEFVPYHDDEELILQIPELKLKINEDNVYAKDLTISDIISTFNILRVNTKRKHKPPSFISFIVNTKVRFIGYYNILSSLVENNKGFERIPDRYIQDDPGALDNDSEWKIYYKSDRTDSRKTKDNSEVGKSGAETNKEDVEDNVPSATATSSNVIEKETVATEDVQDQKEEKSSEKDSHTSKDYSLSEEDIAELEEEEVDSETPDTIQASGKRSLDSEEIGSSNTKKVKSS